MKGRKAKPASLKILRGNPGERPLPAEPKPDPGMPAMPVDLGPIAQAEWMALVPALHRMGVLTSIDSAALEGYCRYREQWLMALRALEEQGPVVSMQNERRLANPYIAIANAASDRMHRYMVELGLTPASRTKLAPSTPADEDPLEQLLRSKLQPRRNPHAGA
jgi:P27 family predicted phage terminase small subunit